MSAGRVCLRGVSEEMEKLDLLRIHPHLERHTYPGREYSRYTNQILITTTDKKEIGSPVAIFGEI